MTNKDALYVLRSMKNESVNSIRTDALDMAIEALTAQLSEEDTTKDTTSGKWIWVECVDAEGLGANAWKCSECGEVYKNDYNFCPNCGAKMEV